MAVLDPVKIVIENMGDAVEMVTMPNHPKTNRNGQPRCAVQPRNLYRSRRLPREANKQYKGLVLGKVRLRNAYVIKAERVEKDEAGEITTIFCSYDAETLSKDPADGRKVKGVIHWVFCGARTCRRKFACTIACSACLTRARRRTSSPPSTRNRW